MRKPKLVTRMQTTRNMVEFTNDNTMGNFKDLFKDIDQEFSDNMESYFEEIAQSLFNNFIIVANDNKFRLAEIEFYFHNEEHPDPFVHSINENDINKHKEKQKEMGQWYFHYSGIDLTFGSEKKNQTGGILLRSLISIENNLDKNDLKGPLKIKNHLLNQYKALDSDKPFLQLREYKHKKNALIKTKPRINLGQSDKNDYRGKRYNFSIE